MSVFFSRTHIFRPDEVLALNNVYIFSCRTKQYFSLNFTAELRSSYAVGLTSLFVFLEIFTLNMKNWIFVFHGRYESIDDNVNHNVDVLNFY